ncbi:MAG: hypothetical protein ACI9O6_002047 [Glaciecola sp.]|jgi:uncharacterized protein (DUF1501 family)
MLSRRKFIKRAIGSTLAMGSYATLGLQLSAAKAFASQTRFDDYKAIVCVFLYGGNDSFNMLVPTDEQEYQAYQQTRQQLAYSRESLISLPLSQQAELSPHGMPASMQSLASIFEQGDLSVLSNIGPLVEPVTKQQLTNNPDLLPPLLFSHNSQQSLWQSGQMKTQAVTGWLGTMADLMQDTNTTLPTTFSISNNGLLTSGTQSQALVLNSTGPEAFGALDANNSADEWRIAAFERLQEQTKSPLDREYAKRTGLARANNQLVQAALDTMPQRTTAYPSNNSLANELKMVADLISVQSALSQQRQLFFVSLGGWDTHDAQVTAHPQLLSTLSEALAAFNADINMQNKGEEVTTVTLSEFGRTLTSNGDGTDHGWAGHQLAMGGAVNGGKVLGYLPQQRIGTNDDIGDGRIIPSTSIEQLGADLASWYGLSDNEIAAVFPNLDRFDSGALKLFT